MASTGSGTWGHLQHAGLCAISDHLHHAHVSASRITSRACDLLHPPTARREALDASAEFNSRCQRPLTFMIPTQGDWSHRPADAQRGSLDEYKDPVIEIDPRMTNSSAQSCCWHVEAA